MFRFLHAADIHLDSPLRGLERYESAPVETVRAAPRRAFEKLIDLAIEQEVAFVLIAGDLYDGDWKDFNTGVFFVQQMRALESAGIPVFLVSGNHDAKSQITKKLRLPSNVKHFDHRRPESVLLEDLGVAIHGQSFAGRSVKEDLSEAYPVGLVDRFDIGLLHTSLDGRPGHDVYAPCSVAGLRAKGYDYWALGHVHRREIVSENPWVVFPGNLQGRHARETGAKGATLVTVHDGLVTSVEHRELDVLRWSEVEVALAEDETAEESIDRVREALEAEQAQAPERSLAVRLRLTGASAAHAELARDPARFITEYREQATALSSGSSGTAIWVEKVRFETRRVHDLSAAQDREDALGDLLRRIARLRVDPMVRAAAKPAGPSETSETSATSEAPEDVADPSLDLVARVADLRKKLPAPLLSGDQGEDGRYDPTDPETLRSALAAARELLLARLLDADGGSSPS